MCVLGEVGEECSEQNITHLTFHLLLPGLIKCIVSCPFGPHTRTHVLRSKKTVAILSEISKCNFALTVNVDNPSSTDVNVLINPLIRDPHHLGQRFSSMLKIPRLIIA